MKSVQVLATATVAVVSLLGSASALPGDIHLLPEVVGATELYAPNPVSGVALDGRDPVAYQFDGTPQAGSAAVSVLWAGLNWRFASEANRAAFLRSPDAFAPRIGGYDATAAADGRLVEASPDIFCVVEGRLYLFRTNAARSRFLADTDAARRAETRWQALQESVIRG